MTYEEALTILDGVLQDTRLNDIQETIFCEAWVGKTFPEIAADLNFTEEHIRSVGSDLWRLLTTAFGEPVKKSNFKAVIERWARNKPLSIKPLLTSSKYQDWGEAVDVSNFFGRVDELATLEKWIVHDRCRLIALLGMGGIGKTSLSVKLAQQIQHQFQYVIWRSLRNAPPLQELLTDLLHFLIDGEPIELAESVNEQLSQLIHFLRDRRCLLVLDNAEMILHSGNASTASSHHAGHYREGYEDYAELLRRVGEIPHQSCLVLTSREEPKEIDVHKGENEPVRAMQLRGLTSAEGREIFRIRGTFLASTLEWNRLIQHYAGNPLALKMVAAVVQDLFDSDIAKFLDLLRQGIVVFDDIRDLVHRQFERLSDDEKEVMYWLAINRELISFTELCDDVLSPSLKRQLTETLKSLGRRFLIEKSPKGFTQQPVITEYVIERLIEQVCHEICTGNVQLLMSHALIKAQSKSFIRESQVRIILQPIADRLRESLKSTKHVERQIRQLLLKLQTDFAQSPGYAAGNLLNLLRQLQVDLTGYDFSNLAVWQAYLQGATLHQVNFAEADLTKSVFTEMLGNIWAVALSPDGKLLAASDTLNKIHLWQIADDKKMITPKKLLTCYGHSNWCGCITFSPDSTILASGSTDNTIKLWDTSTGQCLRTLHGHQDWLLSLSFDATGSLLASGSVDGAVKLWQPETGRCLQTLEGHTNWVRGLAFLPATIDLAHPPSTPPRLISGSADDTVRFWDVKTGDCLQTWTSDSNGVWAIELSPDGQMLATGGADATVKLWHLATGNCVTRLQGHTSHVRSLAFSDDGYRLISSSEDQTIRVWDSGTGECLKVLHGHESAVWSIACRNNVLSSGSLDQRTKLWDVRTGECWFTLQGHTDFVWTTAIVPQPEPCETDCHPLLASGSTDHTIKLWDLNTGECLRSLQGHTNWVLSVAFHRDRRILASSSFDHTIRLWDSLTGHCLRLLQGHTNWVLSVQFSPNGQTLVSSGFDGTVRLWDSNTGECLKILNEHQGRVWFAAFSSDGQRLVSSGEDQTVRLWDSTTGKSLQCLQGHTGRIWSVAFSPDGQWIASGGDDRTIRLWHGSTGEHFYTLKEHDGCVRSIAFSPDGKWLASGSEDKTVKLWNYRTGECIHTLTGHTNRVWSVAFGWTDPTASHGKNIPPGSPFSQILASGSEDETIRLWDLETGSCIRVLQGPKPYEGMNISGVKGLTEAQKTTLKALGAIEN